MSSTEQSAIVTVPTELSRSDGFIDAAVLLGSGLAVWWLALKGVPIWAFIPVLLVLAIFVLTGEPAGDVPFVGAIAAGLRSKLGLRRAHEWVMAWAHYFRVRMWPDFKEWVRCQTLSAKTATTNAGQRIVPTASKWRTRVSAVLIRGKSRAGCLLAYLSKQLPRRASAPATTSSMTDALDS